MGKSNIETRDAVNRSLVQQIEPSTGVTVNTTSDDGVVHRSVFTVSQFTQAVAAANLAWGKALGTMPKVNFFVHAVHLDLAYEASVSDSEAMDIGVGTLIGSGANAVLSGVGAAAEDCLDGQTATVLNGTTEVEYEIAGIGEVDIKDGTSTAKTLYLNAAAANSGITGNILIAGTVTVIWSKLK